MGFELKSPSFGEGDVIPKRHTGEGDDLSPPLEWSGVPEKARELVLVCDDPDAPTEKPWVHWLAYSVPPDLAGLPEGIPALADLGPDSLVRQGRNSWPKMGYNGPMPPRGHGWHRYFFTLYALDRPLEVPPGAAREDLERAMAGHVIAKASLMGRYRRE